MFDVGVYRFKKHPRPAVLRMAPYIRTNEENEESAHAMLFLYVPWPKEGEVNLFRGESTAVCAFAKLKAARKLPSYVLTQIETCKKSDEILNDIGDINHNANTGIENDDAVLANVPMEKSDGDNSDNETTDDETSGFVQMDASNNETIAMSTLDIHTPAGATDVHILTQRQNTYFKEFADNQVATYLNKYMAENSTNHFELKNANGEDHTSSSISSSSSNTDAVLDNNNNTTVRTKVPMNDEKRREEELAVREKRMTLDQSGALKAIWEYIVGIRDSLDETIIQFITGGAGVGKSEYIKCLIEKVRLYFGKQRGLYGSVIIMGPTGGSAHHIGGFTWQSLLGKGFDISSKSQNCFLSQEKAEEIYNRIRGVKLIIIDEVSMVGLEALHEISRRICEAMCTAIADPKERARVNNKPFAGITTVLCGDLYQLGCIKATPIYATNNFNTCAAAGRKIWCSIKLYHNFTASTRFEKQSKNGKSKLELFLDGARIGKPDQRYLTALNTRICLNYEDACNKCNEKAVWLASTHKEVKAINEFMYQKLRLGGAFCMDVLAKHSRNNCPNDHMTQKDRERYYSKTVSKAPVLLRLAIGSRVKITENVASTIGKLNNILIISICEHINLQFDFYTIYIIGMYNGALGTVIRFLFTEKCPPSYVQKPYAAVKNRPIPIVLVQLDEDVKYSCISELPNVVPIVATDSSLCKKVNRLQLPLVAAHACTIHSVQGLTAAHGVTLQPCSSYNAQGLMYVACSRPRKLEDLWLLAPLQLSHFQFGRNTYLQIHKEYARLTAQHSS